MSLKRQRILGLGGLLLGAALLGAAVLVDLRWFEVHVFPTSCPTSGEELGRPRLVRAALALAGLGVLLQHRRGARFLASRTRDWTLRALTVVGAVVLALGASELILRTKLAEATLARPRPARDTTTPATRGPLFGELPPDHATDYFPEWIPTAYGTKPKPSRSTLARLGSPPREVVYHINAQGFRTARPDDVIDFHEPAILFTGESAAFGTGLDFDATTGALVGRHLGIPTVNLAMLGYGHDQAYLRLVEELPRFEHPVAVVTYVLPEQLERNVRSPRPHLVWNGARLVLEGPDAGLAASSPILRLAGRVLPGVGTDGLRVAREIVLATDRAVRARHALPLFVFTSCFIECVADDHGEVSVAHALLDGTAWIEAQIPRDLRIPSDGHPDAKGAAWLAARIEAELRGVGRTKLTLGL